ncbi:MAG: sarcosine oxidase subunit gamma [Hyphomicrobiales bacterium]|nr:sarcosine oxidase subunit gamma [Hyphomicrobiales bacterium]MDE2115834.1 sarcosine oxidase subunit gamma [Hyphomicrobiales bacterium]
MVEMPIRQLPDMAGDERFGTACQMCVVAPRQRLVLRCARPLARAGGFDLGIAINRFSRNGGLVAARVGPDEFWLFGPLDAPILGEVAAAFAAKPHALVDVSHAQAGVSLGGDRVSEVLNAGCPLDLGLAAFPVQMATRTLLGKAPVLLMREAPEHFLVETARSHIDYVRQFIRLAAREYMAP